MSASSSEDQQKTSIESCPQPQRPDSRDFMTSIGSWAAETDAEMKTRRESSSSEHNTSSKQDNSGDDCQPKQILQRPQRLLSCEDSSSHNQRLSESSTSSKRDEARPSADTESKRDDSNTSSKITQILRRSESPKGWSEKASEEQEISKINNEKSGSGITTNISENSSSTKEQSNTETVVKKTDSSTENKSGNEKQTNEGKKDSLNETTSNVISQTKKETGDEKLEENVSKPHAQKRPSPRGGRSDTRGPPTRGYGGMYRSGSSWSRRGSGMRMGGGRNYNDHFSESEYSDDMDGGDYGRRSDRAKMPRKEGKGEPSSSNRSHQGPSSKDGFAPRGEPSRRGRGGSSSGGGSSYRSRGGMSSSNSKRIDSYSASNSKNSYTNTGSTISNNLSHDDKGEKSDRKHDSNSSTTEDKTKLNQMALNAGLSAKKSPQDISDDAKSKNKISSSISSQSSQPKREDKKPSPPKSFGGPHQYHSQVSRKESTSGTSKTISDNQSSENMMKKDDENERGKDISTLSQTEIERKKSLSKEKRVVLLIIISKDHLNKHSEATVLVIFRRIIDLHHTSKKMIIEVLKTNH